MRQVLEEPRQDGKTADDYSDGNFYYCPDGNEENGVGRVFGSDELYGVQKSDYRCYATE